MPGEDDLTKAQVQGLAGDQFAEDVWTAKSMMDSLPRDDYDSLVCAGAMPRVFLADLKTAVQAVRATGKTPLVLCPKDDGESVSKVDAFLGYQDCAVIEAKQLIKEVCIDKSSTAAQAGEALLRPKLIASLGAFPPANGRYVLL